MANLSKQFPVKNIHSHEAMKPVQIVWFRKDLRISDHLPLLRASLSSYPLMPLYIVDPEDWLESEELNRKWFLLRQRLIDLDLKLTSLGAPLVVKIGHAEHILESISASCEIQAIHTQELPDQKAKGKSDKTIQNWCLMQKKRLVTYPNHKHRLTNQCEKNAQPNLEPGPMRGFKGLKSDPIPTDFGALFKSTGIIREKVSQIPQTPL